MLDYVDLSFNVFLFDIVNMCKCPSQIVNIYYIISI